MARKQQCLYVCVCACVQTSSHTGLGMEDEDVDIDVQEEGEPWVLKWQARGVWCYLSALKWA